MNTVEVLLRAARRYTCRATLLTVTEDTIADRACALEELAVAEDDLLAAARQFVASEAPTLSGEGEK